MAGFKRKFFSNILLKTKPIETYLNIIEKAFKENRVKLNKEHINYIYYEAHHILPKSIYKEYSSFKDYSWNKVLLTAREHFICHGLLVQHYRKLNKKKEWHQMSLALSKLKCNNKYYNSKLYENIRKNYKHSKETCLNISKAHKEKSKIVKVFRYNEHIETLTLLEAKQKYFPNIFKYTLNKPYGSGGFRSRQVSRRKGLDKYFGFYVERVNSNISNSTREEISRIHRNNIEKDYRKIYVYKYNKLIEVLEYIEYKRKYRLLLHNTSINNIKGNSRESQYSLKNKGNEHLIGMWISENKIKPNIDFNDFGNEYVENKIKYKIFNNKELLIKCTKPDICREFYKIRNVLFGTSKDEPLGYGSNKQNLWLKKNNLIPKYKGYYLEEVK